MELTEQPELWIPFAMKYRKPLITRGEHPQHYPEGMVVHCSAGRDRPSDLLEYALTSGYVYLVLERNGTLWQAHPLNKWGSHAGKANWHEWGSQVSYHTVGIECISAGKLEDKNGELKTWWGEVVPRSEARYVERVDNCAYGYYHKLTMAQEETLENLCWWLHANNPQVFKLENIVGHDEVAPGRKTDPGGSLSRTMPKYREYLKSSYEVHTNG